MVLAIIMLTASAIVAQPVDYRIESGGDNKISLEVEKTGLMKGKKHQFVFPRFQGKLSFDSQAPANSRVELKIDATSLVCQDTWVSAKDLKKIQDAAIAEMLLAKQYPEMRFTSTKVTPQGGNRFQVEGTLTIRGVGKPVILDATLKPDTMTFEGKSVFKMTGYGMKPPSAGLGTIGTKDEMTAVFQIQAKR